MARVGEADRMPLDIETALGEGVERTIARNGLLLVAILFGISLLNGLAAFGALRRLGAMGMGPFFGGATGPFGGLRHAPTVELSPGTAGALGLLLTLATIVVTIGALRTFVTDETERLPPEAFSRNVVLAVLNLLVGGLVFGIVVGIGFILLVLPGFFLLVSLFFWNVFVVVEDRNFIDGFRSSWALTRGHRWRLFALGVAVLVVTAVVNLLFGLPGVLLPNVLAFTLGQLGSALTTVFTLATVARTYDQLVTLEAEGDPAAAV